jgi:hypothetical protein
MVSMVKFIQCNWCPDIDISYEWAKGYSDHRNEEPKKKELLNIEADTMCNIICAESTGHINARGNCTLW